MIPLPEEKRLVAAPPDLGSISLRQLPRRSADEPGGFMNPPTLRRRPEGSYFIPTYDRRAPTSPSAPPIEEPEPLSCTKGFPGTSCSFRSPTTFRTRIRRARRRPSSSRLGALQPRRSARTGLYPEGSAAQGQVRRLSALPRRPQSASTSTCTPAADLRVSVKYSWRPGAAIAKRRGEAAGAASSPTQTPTGRQMQIMRLLGCPGIAREAFHALAPSTTIC